MMMTNIDARKFALDSFVTAFEAGNEQMIDQYFAADLEFRNHSVAKNYSLDQIKMSVLEVHKKFNLSVDGDRVFKLVAAIILQVLVTSVLAFGGGLFWVE